MPAGLRLTIAGLVVAAIAVVLGTTVVPTHVTFGAGALRCGTVFRPDRNSEIAPLCGPAGANHLRQTLFLGAALAVLAFLPLIFGRTRAGHHPAVWVAWGAIVLLTAILGVARLGLVEYAAESVFFDL